MRRPSLTAASLAALALGVPPPAQAGSGGARLIVSANVVRSMTVSVTAGARGTGVHVRTPAGTPWSAPLDAAARTPGITVASCAADPRYLVVTVHADAPLGESRSEQHRANELRSSRSTARCRDRPPPSPAAAPGSARTP